MQRPFELTGSVNGAPLAHASIRNAGASGQFNFYGQMPFG